MAERQNICDHSIQNNCIDIFMCLVVLTDPENTQLIKKMYSQEVVPKHG